MVNEQLKNSKNPNKKGERQKKDKNKTRTKEHEKCRRKKVIQIEANVRGRRRNMRKMEKKERKTDERGRNWRKQANTYTINPSPVWARRGINREWGGGGQQPSLQLAEWIRRGKRTSGTRQSGDKYSFVIEQFNSFIEIFHLSCFVVVLFSILLFYYLMISLVALAGPFSISQ